MNNNYKNTHSLEERLSQSQKIKEKYPDRISCIVEKSLSDIKLAKLDKYKYLVPHDLTFGQFIYVIRKRIKIQPHEAIFLYVNNILPATSDFMGEIYKKHKDIDGFLYITYSGENVFGNN